jgi:hypothetical protein
MAWPRPSSHLQRHGGEADVGRAGTHAPDGSSATGLASTGAATSGVACAWKGGARRKPCYLADDGDALVAPFSSLEVSVVAPPSPAGVELRGENQARSGQAAVTLCVTVLLEGVAFEVPCHGACGAASSALRLVVVVVSTVPTRASGFSPPWFV